MKKPNKTMEPYLEPDVLTEQEKELHRANELEQEEEERGLFFRTLTEVGELYRRIFTT